VLTNQFVWVAVLNGVAVAVVVAAGALLVWTFMRQWFS